ncbi:hypothetical protein A1O3_07266 [Capronia epimyces CBS 606.96]|uniref:Uncharacterized protein n=1 Tax=Capronia epimyces CBS 606.96 TaxID=1182542 RepID=W9XLB1_9EURO|nr:uncharacterized protein A1O3_07266 [Capronia epimyces CBS 606.96]EXJ80978.1 hypothetical protein A1O3_07266 [Capronia epimyces CBS 606.96]
MLPTMASSQCSSNALRDTGPLEVGKSLTQNKSAARDMSSTALKFLSGPFSRRIVLKRARYLW